MQDRQRGILVALDLPRWFCLASVTLLAGAGCGGQRAGPALLRVAAASDLQQALPVLAARFREITGTEVVCTFGSSGQLADQIRGGAPFDLFLAANRAFVAGLAAERLVEPASVRPYAQGSLVVAVHKGAGVSVAALADLAQPAVRKIAIANPAFAPYGAAAKQALERAGLWDSLQPRIVQAETVRQALEFVESGNAEAGLVGRAIARTPAVEVVAVDAKLYDPIVQAVGVVAASPRRAEAEAFARFILSDPGQRILADFGFARAESQGDGRGDSRSPRR